jgi:hypothetical protein
MTKNEPPKVLVITWLELLKINDNKELQRHAEKMLISAFGSMQEVADYVKRNNISI